MMKKKLILCLLLFILLKVNVKAASFNTIIVGNDTFKDEITLNVQVSNLVDFNGSCKGLCGLVANLNYDENKLELVDISSINGFDLTKGKVLVLYKETGVSSGSNIMSLKFKNKGLENNETTDITLSNIVASDGDTDINGNNVSKTIKFIKETVNNNTSDNNNTSGNNNTSDNNNTSGNNNTNTNSNNTSDNNTSSNNNTSGNNNTGSNNNTSSNNNSGNTTNNKPTTSSKPSTNSQVKSSNNNLKSLEISDGSIEFQKDLLEYQVTVLNDVDEITIEATSEDSKSTIKGVGTHTLNIGENIIEVIVTAENGTSKTYKIIVTREEEIEEIEDEEEDNDINTVIDNPSNEEKEKKNSIIPIIIISLIIILILIVILLIRFKNKNKSSDE